VKLLWFLILYLLILTYHSYKRIVGYTEIHNNSENSVYINMLLRVFNLVTCTLIYYTNIYIYEIH
jgi:hypothetical protein